MNMDALRSQLTTFTSGGLSSLQTTVAALIENPGQNRQLSLLVLSVAVLLVILLLVMVALIITPSRRRVVRRVVMVEVDDDVEQAKHSSAKPEDPQTALADASENADAHESAEATGLKRSSRLFLAATSPAASAVIGLLLLAGAYVATSTDYYCARTCHAQTEPVASADAADHAWCVSCHEKSGLFGIPANVVSRTRMLAARMTGTGTETAATVVDSGNCLVCHRSVLGETVVSSTGVRMSHAEVYESARPCSQCHSEAGHTARAYSGAMSACIVCHDNENASAECEVCHAKDPVAAAMPTEESTKTIGAGRIQYAAVRASNRECDGCHDMEANCDPCHGGIRMPHSEHFRGDGHAPAAAFSRKKVCFRCHDQSDCGDCHSASFDPTTGLGGHPNWVIDHRAASWNSGCVCHTNRTTRKGPMCDLCHDAETHQLLPVAQ